MKLKLNYRCDIGLEVYRFWFCSVGKCSFFLFLFFYDKCRGLLYFWFFFEEILYVLSLLWIF